MGGDENTFTKWVAERLVYPEKAKKESITGRVILQFMVTSKGKVDDVKIVRGVHPELDQEAIRVVMSSPDWEPGKEKGKNVNVVYTFPVIFMLGEKK
jgi:TonB family protein